MNAMIAVALLQLVAASADPPTLQRAAPAGAILDIQDMSGDEALIQSLAGKEARRFMPAGAIVRISDLREPLLVVRNRPVRVRFIKGSLSISAEGRALSDGALGESVRVMAPRSKLTITGVVVGKNSVAVE